MFFGARNVDGKVFIGYTSLRKYTPKNIKSRINRTKITCECKTGIISMLLQLYLNTWRLSQLAKLDKLYINPALTILLQRSKHDFIEYKNQRFKRDNQYSNINSRKYNVHRNSDVNHKGMKMR